MHREKNHTEEEGKEEVMEQETVATPDTDTETAAVQEEAPSEEPVGGKKIINIKVAIMIAALIIVLAVLYSARGLFVAATVNGSPIGRMSVVSQLEKASGQKLLDTLITKKLIAQDFSFFTSSPGTPPTTPANTGAVAESMTDPAYYIPLAQAAEAAGYHGMTIADSVAYPSESDATYPYTPDGNREFLDDKEMPEAFVLASALSAMTSTLRLNFFVLKLPIRPPNDEAQYGFLFGR
jgi:hypothetical protein